MKSVAVCDEKSYEMNKCLSLVYLTTNWLTEVFARDLPPVARKAAEKPTCTKTCWYWFLSQSRLSGRRRRA